MQQSLALKNKRWTWSKLFCFAKIKVEAAHEVFLFWKENHNEHIIYGQFFIEWL